MAIALTDKAAARVKQVLAEKKAAAEVGLRVAIKGGGCSGFNYHLDLDDKVTKFDQVFESNGVRVICDKKSYLFVNGTEIDFEKTRLGSGFVFKNPIAKGSCGCGESFTI